jgi:2-iminobutanoate/2-iminopropanoate deaminase
MTRRKFIKRTTATAVGATAVAQAESKPARGSQTGASQTGGARAKAKTTRRKVSTDAAPKPAGPYSQAVVAGNTIYVAGQGPFNPATGKMPAGFEEQAAQTFDNIKAIVESAGATLQDVVKVNVYLTDLANFAKMNEVYMRYFRDPFPARATVGTQLLGGMMIEVECVAVI